MVRPLHLARAILFAPLLIAAMTAPAQAIAQSRTLQLASPSVQFFPRPGIATDSAALRNAIFWLEIKHTSVGQRGPAPTSLFKSPIASFHPHVIHTFALGTAPTSFQVSQHWAVAALTDSSNRLSLWALDRQSTHSQTFRLHAPSPTFGLAISANDEVVYPSTVPSGKKFRSELRAVNLVTGVDRVVLSRTGTCKGELGAPSISGSIWVGAFITGCHGQLSPPKSWDVYRYDSATHRLKVVTSDHRSFEPVSNGRYIAWISDVNPPASGPVTGLLYLLDTKTGRRIHLGGASTGMAKQCFGKKNGPWDGCASHLGITSALVYWITSAGRAVALDLAQDKLYGLSIPSTKVPALGQFGQGNGHHMTWAISNYAAHPGRVHSWVGVATIP